MLLKQYFSRISCVMTSIMLIASTMNAGIEEWSDLPVFKSLGNLQKDLTYSTQISKYILILDLILKGLQIAFYIAAIIVLYKCCRWLTAQTRTPKG